MLWFKKRAEPVDPPEIVEVAEELIMGGPYRPLHALSEVNAAEETVPQSPNFNDELVVLHQEKYAEISRHRHEILLSLKGKIKDSVATGANMGTIHIHEILPKEKRGLTRDDSLCQFLAEALEKEGLEAKSQGYNTSSWIEWSLRFKGSGKKKVK